MAHPRSYHLPNREVSSSVLPVGWVPSVCPCLWPHQDRKLAELNLVNGLLLAERAILFTLNFDMRDYALKGHLKSYLVALGVASAARQGGSPAPAPANELKEDQKAALMQIINVFATHM